ncbi:MAG: pyridoxamine 5'-phosphate oxidase family protein [Actinomycetota bacterium]
MHSLSETAPAFVDMAHRIVWCTVATVGPDQQPRTRVLHPLWEWDGERLTGVIATGPTPVKRRHLEHSPRLSCTYWDPSQDVATADCTATWAFDDETCSRVWEAFKTAPDPVGYDPAIIPPWADGPTSDAFAVLRLEPQRLRVFPGSVLLGQGGEVLNWRGS